MAERLPDEIPLAQSVNLAIPETEGVRLLAALRGPMDAKEQVLDQSDWGVSSAARPAAESG